MQCVVNRRAQFLASHHYSLPELGETENLEKFGRSSKFPGQGHNYTLFISIAGELDKYGMVLNLSDVKQVIKREITDQLDFSYLNNVWPEFQQTLSSNENIARVIWERLAPHLPLIRVQLVEHPGLWADYMGEGMQASLSISTHFSAAHRLASNLSSEKYSKCSRTHGHNYHLEVTVEGEMDSRTGMIIDLDALNRVVENDVVKIFDHFCVNQDIPHFAEIVPTTENLVLYISNLLKSPIQKLGAKLSQVKLFESPQLWVDYQGNGTETFLTVKSEFSSAHRLAHPDLSLEKNTEIYGKCARVNGHGHNYQLEVTVKGKIDSCTGMVVDLGALNQVIANLTEPLDHSFLNRDVPYFGEVVPTAENIALYISNMLRLPIQELGTELYKVKLVESPNNSCEIYPSDIESTSVTKVQNQPVLATV
jgi:6-pyruvoyltetrahydropterin/6-carboxytetrahydropterin synthase